MTSHHRCTAALLLMSALAVSSLPRMRSDWLERVVQHHKEKFFNELSEPAPVKAQIQPKPEGFQDSAHWDYDSVVRLLTLIRGSETAKKLRRMLGSTRRYRMSMIESMHWFPSIKKDDDIYYDVDYSSEKCRTCNSVDSESQLITITNAVEAHLPSASISVDHLKKILEAKAHALRQMPVKPEAWYPKSTTMTTEAAAKKTLKLEINDTTKANTKKTTKTNAKKTTKTSAKKTTKTNAKKTTKTNAKKTTKTNANKTTKTNAKTTTKTNANKTTKAKAKHTTTSTPDTRTDGLSVDGTDRTESSGSTSTTVEGSSSTDTTTESTTPMSTTRGTTEESVE